MSYPGCHGSVDPAGVQFLVLPKDPAAAQGALIEHYEAGRAPSRPYSRSMDNESITDDDLLYQLQLAQQTIPGTAADPERGRAAWKVVVDLTRELERRYPPAAEPLP